MDAVNEFAGDVAELVRQLDQLVQQSAGHDWFRVVTSVRDSAYQRLPTDARFGARGLARYLTVEEERGTEKIRTPVVALGPLGTDHVEALYEAYRSYRQRDPDDADAPGVHRFRPTTAFSELSADGSTRALLRSPLMARLVMEAHHRRALPSDLRSDQAMRLYLEQVVVESGSPGGGFPERRRVLTALVREMDRISADTVPRDALTQVPALRASLLNPQRDSPYVQLVELGVLLEEWDGDTCMVRFAFDRLFEFLLAELHDPRVQSAADALSLARRAVVFRGLRGALEAILGRACEQGRERLLVEWIDVTADQPEGEIRLLTREVAVGLVVRLAREKDPAFHRILGSMPTAPSAADVDVLSDVADRLALVGEVGTLEAVLEVLEAEATALREPKVLTKALFRKAKRLEVRGEWDDALTAFEGAERAAREAEDRSTAATARVRMAAIRGRRGDFEVAERELRSALDERRADGDRRGIAECTHEIGVLFYRCGDGAQADRHFLESLEFNRKLGDKVALAKSLNNLGVISEQQGDTLMAERRYNEALEIRQELGDKSGVGSTLMNLGALAHHREDFAEAERLLRKSLDIRRELGDRGGVAACLNNLGNLARTRGQFEEALRLYGESLTIKRELGDKVGVGKTLVIMVFIAAQRLDLTGAELLYQEAQTVRKELAGKAKLAGLDTDGVVRLLRQIGTTAERVHDVSRAEYHYREALAVGRETINAALLQSCAFRLMALLAANKRPIDASLQADASTVGQSEGVLDSRATAAQAEIIMRISDMRTSMVEIDALLDAVRGARAQQEESPEVEDGPATPFLLAARWFQDHGHPDRAAELAREALAEVGERFWPYRREAEAMAQVSTGTTPRASQP